MRLKAIKLAGFKSFVDPTTVTFKSQMTAVVGPNGCGKSNIIDAVRWVMGESSAKYLRGESMTDVIFNGSQQRKPVSQASIELVFDNREGRLGGPYADYAELAVKRLVTRDGQSNYFLNGSKCRRRDITDLFLGTGLGARSYAIIEQGMISRLIEARPEELRVYLEEAAGISKYKERRKETENRIRRTQENLERLDDVREELARQLERLGRQAAAAQRYQELRRQERRLKAELAVMRWRTADQQLQHKLETIRRLEVEKEAELAQLRQGEAQLEARREAQEQAAAELEAAQQQLNQYDLQIARLEQGLQHQRQRERQLQQSLDEAQQQQAKVEAALAADQAQLSHIHQTLQTLAPQVAELQQAEQHQLAIQDELEQAYQQLQETWDAFYRKAEAEQQRATLAQAKIQQLEAQRQRLTQQEERLQQQQAGQQEDWMALRLEEVELEREAIEESLLELQEELHALQQQQEQLEQQSKEQRQLQHQQATQLQQQQGRLASLQALQQAELEGQDAELETWLEQQGWADYPRLGAWLATPPGWEKAFEVVLGSALQAFLVPPTSALATAWLAPPSGECRWFVQPDPLTSAELEPQVGCWAGSLGAMLDQAVELPASVRQLLALYRPADSLADALAHQADLAPGEAWITPTGDRVLADGGMLLASQQSQSGVLLRQKALRDLETQIASLEEAYALSEAQQEASQQAKEALQHEQQQLQQRLQVEQQQLNQLMTEQVRLSEQQRSAAEQQRQREEQAAELEAEREELSEQLQLVREEWEEALLQLEAHAEERAQLDAQRQQLRTEREAQKIQQRSMTSQWQAAQLKYQELITQEQACQQAMQRLSEQRQLHLEQTEQLQLDLEQLRDPDDLQMAELEERLEQRLDQEEQVAQIRQVFQQVQEAQKQLEQQRQVYEKRLDALRQELEEQRLQQQSLMVQRDHHLEHLQQEGLNLKEVLEELSDTVCESEWQEALHKAQEQIRRLGAINLAAIEEYDQQAERKHYLDAQNAELCEALETLDQAIKRIDRETRQRFKDTFNQVNQGLQTLFPKVFGGGTAWLQLTGEDLLETGVSIMARPPGKKNATIHLLSGGEKALTALALVFSIFELNPAPFCMLDEVDAPLDDTNVGRYAALVKEMSASIQFIYITHNKQAMESAEQLMGVTMQEPGVSRLVSVDLEEAAALVGES
ncbi:chromosome segregation protein SMC [Marinospirillum sp. MEB164]|uniref:Chromosome partition protein Smc n=1 Tax=Marinospirillum alkalitolerans TaxID=3123374 RepID=A0ABW8PU25_9GAMM